MTRSSLGRPIQRVLVLGATSLIGRFLLPALAQADYHVVAVSRAVPNKSDASVSWVRADLADLELGGQLAAVDAVVSLSPIWLLPAALPELRTTGALRLIAFSSTSRTTKAASPIAAERAVARRLAEGEAEAAAFCDAADIAWTIFRPTMIYAEGHDQNISRLAALIMRLGVLPLAGAGAGLRQPVHAQDLAAAILASLQRPESAGRIYDLPGGETLTYRAMVERVFAGLGRPPRVLAVPPFLWRLALKIASPLLPGATAAMGDRMSADLVFDAGPAIRDLGWAPRTFHPRFTLLQGSSETT